MSALNLESEKDAEYVASLKTQMEAELKEIRGNRKKWSTAKDWKPVSRKASVPEKGVRLLPGPLRRLFDANIAVIKHCFSIEDYCEGEPADFIKRINILKPAHGWSGWLPGSNDGRMLSGAANALRWEEDQELRKIVNKIIAGIKERMRDDGYNNYYSEEVSYALRHYPHNLHKTEVETVSILTERKNYDRVFWTRGMIAAGLAGNADALPLARRMYDWFNNAGEFLPDLLLGGNAANGFPGGPLMYHTPLGREEDIITNKRFLDQDYWIKALTEKQPLAFSHYPGERPHCYCLLFLEALADEYRATGEKKYLEALLGGWEVYRDNYKHPGGATAICEADGPYPPKSYYLTSGHNGETCGSVFWIWINQRLMQLGTEEKYAAEIEEAIVNVILACRDEKGHTRYHNRLHGKKEPGLNQNTCCEVSSTGLISSLPEYIFMDDDSGIYVNLFFSAEFEGKGRKLKLSSAFPLDGKVAIEILSEGKFDLRVRIPVWAGDIPLLLNGEAAQNGKQGTYVSIERVWKKGDTISFNLPYKFRAVEYTGFDAAPNGRRYGLFYGPVLLALTGDFEEKDIPVIQLEPSDPGKKLSLEPDKDLHFKIRDLEGYQFIPYYQINTETFTCFPVYGD
jgi:DUF1680 family protein